MNELSLRGSRNEFEANAHIQTLVETYVEARKAGFQRIKTDQEFLGREIAASYSFANWLERGPVDGETKSLMKAALSSTPFIEEMIDGEEGLLEYSYQGSRCYGLGAADLFRSFSLSLSGIAAWQQDWLPVQCETVEENEQGELESVNIDARVPNIHNVSSLGSLESEIIQRKKSSVVSGKSFWLQKSAMTPHLEYLDSAKRYIWTMSGNETLLPHIVQLLLDLNHYVGTWRNAPIPFRESDIQSVYRFSGESKETLDRFSSVRTFSLPENGGERVFELHGKIRYRKTHWRVHFFPSDDRQKVYIGYIGPHLPTFSNPT